MRTALALAFLAVLAADPAPAAPTEPYALRKDSEFEYGCFGPCACPVLIRSGVYGEFHLALRGSEGSFTVYDVTDVSWFVPQAEGTIPVTGFGEYRIGGEVAIQEQLTLSLRVGNHDPRVYDSGLRTKTVPFPAIEIDIAAHSAVCFDTVFTVRAGPATVDGNTLSDSRFGIRAIQPNPMLAGAVIDFALPNAATTTLSVFDVRGQRRATLIDRWLDAGPYRIPWNGIGEEGRPLPAGVYWFELVAGGRRDVQRAVKLQPGSPDRIPFSP